MKFPFCVGVFNVLVITSVVSALSACASAPMSPPSAPDVVTPPAGAKYAMTLVGVGDLTYECRNNAATNTMAWAFVAPEAALNNASGARVGRYYGGPTWEGNDGSKVVGKQLAIAPAPAGNIPLQLVEVTTSAAAGMFAGVKYIQRLSTVGGVAPAVACSSSNVGMKQTVKYQADYAFYR